MSYFICTLIEYLRALNIQNLLTYSALVLAFLAYRKNFKDKYSSLKVLIASFNSELRVQSPWLGNSYDAQHQDKLFFSPYKVVFKLSFLSAEQISRLGISVFGHIDNELNNLIASFNERVLAFNALLDYQMNLVTANAVLSGNLQRELLQIGLDNPDVSYDDFVAKLSSLSASVDKQNIFWFAQQVHLYNFIIHVNLIGNTGDFDLHNVHLKISEKLKSIENTNDKTLPWFVKTKWFYFVLLISFTLMIVLANILK